MDASFQTGVPQSWLPDETLFSLCSRYHRASGNRLSATTCKALFGHPTQGCAHDFPARLDYFRSVAGETLGSVKRLIEERSVLPIYLRFASEDMVSATVAAAAQSSSGRLKFQLGLLTSRFRANHPLKACGACMIEDAQLYATPYWHREHQLPGVWICRRHGCWLQASDLKATGVSRLHWVLPSASQFGPAKAIPPSSSVIKLADMVANLVAKAGLSIAPQQMSLAFRAALSDQGLLGGPRQRLRHAIAGDQYAEFLAPLLALEQMSHLPATGSEASMEIARCLASERPGVHPLRRLTLAAWLFRDSGELLACVGGTADPIESMRPNAPPASPQEQNPRRSYFLTLMGAGSSTSAAALAAGIDTTTGMAWAAAAGLATPRRPKILKGDLRTRLMDLLRRGVAKGKVAARGGVSVQTVTTLLRTEVGLHEAWRHAGFENARRRNRRVWERVTSANPLSGVKAARMAEPAVYAWLYRNDRDWLSDTTTSMAKAVRSPQARVDWDARDRQLADEVRDVALHLVEGDGSRCVKLFQLYQRIPELKAKLFKLDRLPLTKAAIFDVVGRRGEK